MWPVALLHQTTGIPVPTTLSINVVYCFLFPAGEQVAEHHRLHEPGRSYLFINGFILRKQLLLFYPDTENESFGIIISRLGHWCVLQTTRVLYNCCLRQLHLSLPPSTP